MIMATQNLTLLSPPPLTGVLTGRQIQKSAWRAAAERIDRLGDLISDIPHSQVKGRDTVTKLQRASSAMDQAIQELSSVVAGWEVQS
jgi:hypothetical protein